MRKQLSILVLLLLPLLALAQNAVVPRNVNFADIQIRISDRGQKEIQKKVDALHRYPSSFQKKVELADMYFPLIERIFREEGIPEDFKYLAIQESGLVSDAVSSSNAVGFWQFKKEAASDFNLRVDNQVDERRHIIEASRGAAKYMKRSNSYYNNWLNTLLSYNLGLTGAKSYTRSSDIGSRKMEVTDKTHPYVLTFLAHKIAYEDFVGKTKTPPLALRELRAKPGQSLKEIAHATQVEPTEIERYNKWLLGNKIPSDKDYYVMIPIVNGDDRGLLAANTADNSSKPSVPSIFRGFGRSTKHSAASVVKRNGLNTIVATNGDTKETLAQKAGLTTRKFLSFNDMYDFDKIQEGTAYYIERKNVRADKEYHVVQPGENMQQISQHYGIQLRYLLSNNRMSRTETPAPGRVLWLQKRRPANEPVEVRKLGNQQVASTATASQPKATFEAGTPAGTTYAKASGNISREQTQQAGTSKTVQTQNSAPKENVFKRFINSFKRFKNEPEEQEEVLVEDAPSQQPAEAPTAPAETEDEFSEPASTQAPASKEEPTTNPALYPGNRKASSAEAFEEEAPIMNTETAVATEETETERETATTAPATNVTSLKSATHVVKQGETLYSISRMYAVSLNDINKWNNLGDTPLKIGQELIIAEPLTTPSQEASSGSDVEATAAPAAEQNKAFHTVSGGETLYQVSKKYNVTVDQLRSWNNLTENTLSVGQELRISAPDNETAAPAAPKEATSATGNQSDYHTVATGESMYQISRKYGVTIKDIMEWNNKSDFSVSVGEKLLVKKK